MRPLEEMDVKSGRCLFEVTRRERRGNAVVSKDVIEATWDIDYYEEGPYTNNIRVNGSAEDCQELRAVKNIIRGLE